MTWRDRDALFNPIKSIVCILVLAVFMALVAVGMMGAVWAIVETVKMVLL